MSDPTNETQTEEVDVASADGDEAVSEDTEQASAPSAEDTAINEAVDSADVKQDDNLLDSINSRLGKNFKDIDSAISSWKELQTSYSQLQQKPSEKNEDPITREEFDREMFFKDNTEVDRGLAEMVSKNEGIPVQEAVKHDSYKLYADKVKQADDAQAAKSVLESNPRLGAVKDKMKSAQDILSEAKKADVDTSIKLHEQAGNKAVSAVIDSFDS